MIKAILISLVLFASMIAAPSFHLLKIGANDAALTINLHDTTTVPVMRNQYINTQPQNWSVNGDDHYILMRRSGMYELSSVIDITDVSDTIQNNCAIQMYVDMNGTRISPYYRSNYFTQVVGLNKSTITIPDLLFTCRVSDTIRIKSEPIAGDTSCTMFIETILSYITLKKY